MTLVVGSLPSTQGTWIGSWLLALAPAQPWLLWGWEVNYLTLSLSLFLKNKAKLASEIHTAKGTQTFKRLCF